MSLHLNFLRSLAGRWKQTALRSFEFDEILSVSYIEAEQLLRTKYDPAQTTVTTFLSSFLFGRVQYTLLRGQDMRKREDGWKTIEQLAPRPKSEERTGLDELELCDLISSLPIDLQETARRLAEGDSLFKVLVGFDRPSFDTADEASSLFDPFVDQVRELLREAIRRRLHD